MKKEIWKRIKGFDDYKISSFGNVYSEKTNKILKQQISYSGYMRVCLYDENYKQHTKAVHRIVVSNFIKNTKNKPQVNHKNCIRDDNRLENLEWATPTENIVHAWKYGDMKALQGESHPSNKLTEIDVLQIRKENKQGVKQRDLAKRFNVCFANISCICKGMTWKHLTL